MDSTCTWDIVSGGIEINLGNIHIGCPNQLRTVKTVPIIGSVEVIIIRLAYLSPRPMTRMPILWDSRWLYTCLPDIIFSYFSTTLKVTLKLNPCFWGRFCSNPWFLWRYYSRMPAPEIPLFVTAITPSRQVHLPCRARVRPVLSGTTGKLSIFSMILFSFISWSTILRYISSSSFSIFLVSSESDERLLLSNFLTCSAILAFKSSKDSAWTWPTPLRLIKQNSSVRLILVFYFSS